MHLGRRPEPDWSPLAADGARVLQATRHQRKLPRGALAGNRFRIVLRDVDGDVDAARARLAAIAADGVPNYFGEQRFGRGGGNVEAALAMFAGRRVDRAQRSILLSAARSQLYNQVLARRVLDGSWNQAVEGDVFQLDGRGSVFGPEPLDEVLRQRRGGRRDPPHRAAVGRRRRCAARRRSRNSKPRWLPPSRNWRPGWWPPA